jgi:hypothetical protein
MSVNQSTCSLGVSRETLSAWRDRALPDAEAQRIAAHVARCSACQRRLAQFARIAAAVQRQPAPDLRVRTWRGLQVRLTRRGGQPMHARLVAAFRGIGATAVVALIAALFVVVLSHRPGANTRPAGVVASATPAPECPNFPTGYYAQIPNPGYTSTDVFANLPLPPESRIVPNDASGGERGYDVCSAGTVASITSFMAEHLAALGWTAAGGGVWTKDGYSLTVLIPSATDWNIHWRDPDLHF